MLFSVVLYFLYAKTNHFKNSFILYGLANCSNLFFFLNIIIIVHGCMSVLKLTSWLLQFNKCYVIVNVVLL